MLYGLLTKPYPTCYVQGVGKYSCSTDGKSETFITQQQIDPDPNHQLIEKCWLNIKNCLILSSFVPGVTVLVVSAPFWSRVFKCANTACKNNSKELRNDQPFVQNKIILIEDSMKTFQTR